MEFQSEYLDHDRIVRLYRVVLATGFAGGLALIAGALLAPDFPVTAINVVFPDEPYEVAALLRVTPQVLLVLYGVILSGVSVGLYLFSQAFLHSVGKESEGLRRRTFTRFIATASFITGFIGARALTTLSGIIGPASEGLAAALPVREVWVQGFHIHHFFFGFLFLSIVGWLSVFRNNYSKNLLAAFYGLGMGVFVDEFGLLLTGESYFAPSTYFVAVTFFSILIAGVYWDLSRHSS